MQNKYHLREKAHENIDVKSRTEFIPRIAFKNKKMSTNDEVFSTPLLNHYSKFFNVEERKFPFLRTICRVLRGPEEYNPDFNTKQYVLLGSPSAGKTTELRRIARELISAIDDDQIIHLCCLQNTSSVQRKIESKEDLWDWIMRSHESRIWSEERYSLDQFAKIHRDSNLNPILLVDTVDLLIYGQIDTENSKIISGFWKEIVEDLKQHSFTVLWSCRSLEWEMINPEHRKMNLVEINLPPLNDEKIKQKYEDVSTEEHFQKHMVTLSLAFPIIIGHKLNYSQQFNLKDIENRFKEAHLKMREAHIDEAIVRENAGPISWIVQEMNGRIATDILFEGVVEKMIRYIVQMYHYETQEVRNCWEDIEKEFYYAAKPKSTLSRIQIDSSYLDDYKDKALTQALVSRSQHFGILNSNGDTLEMSHQLFAEYCVWKHKKDTDGELMKKFPSGVFRGSINDAQPSTLKEGRKWFLPYLLFNKDLAHLAPDQHLPQAWKKILEHARYYQRDSQHVILSPKNLHIGEENKSRMINEEKMDVLNTLSDDFPLIINGPPGVGKSHLSYIWIDKMALGNNWIQLESKKTRSIVVEEDLPSAYFMTQSPRLARQISEKIDDYYGQDVRPVIFENWGISEYLIALENVLEIKSNSYHFDDFEREWKNYSQGSGNNEITDLKKMSTQALWYEFLHRVIDNQGRRKTLEEYKRGRSDVFQYCRAPEKAQEEFGKWAIDVRKRDRYSLSERAGKCLEKTIQVFLGGSLKQRESVHSLQPDILVLDEIQDLPAPVILLMLIMHKGKTNTVMMCGDDEQTLELIQFNWNLVFSQISTAIHSLCSELDEKGKNDLEFVQKWKDIQSMQLNKIQEKHTKYLKVVERSIPEIVDTLRQSWLTSVTELDQPESIKVNRDEGTGAIKAGKFADARYKSNIDKEIAQGVIYFDIKDDSWFTRISTEIYEQALDVAILLPDKTQWEKYQNILEEKDINIELWTPRLIKGLEYSVVIAVNPWHIDTEHFTDVVGSNISTWGEAERYIMKHKLKDGSEKAASTNEAISLLANQRRRHSNIMLSRGMDQLFIISEKNTEMIVTKDANLDILEIKKSSKHNDDWFGQKNRTNYQGINRLIKRLSLIMQSAETEGDFNQVMFKSKHILSTLQDKVDVDYFPFFLLSNIELVDGLDILAIGLDKLNQFAKLNSPLTVEKEIDNKKWDDFNHLKEFWKYIYQLTESCKIVDGALQIPILLFNEYNSELEEFIQLFSKPNDTCFDEEEGMEEREREIQKTIISDYIIQRIFGGRRESELKAEEWCAAAKTIDLESFSITLDISQNPRFKLLYDILVKTHAKGEDGDQFDKNKKYQTANIQDVDRAFWQEGTHHLARIVTSDLIQIRSRLYDQLSDGRNSLSHEGIDFLSRLIPRSLKFFGTNDFRQSLSVNGVLDICNICNVLDTQAKIKGHELPDLQTQIHPSAAKIIAEYLSENTLKENVLKALISNSFGLYNLFNSHIMIVKTEFNFKKVMQLGQRVLDELAKQRAESEKGSEESLSSEDWERTIITDLQKYSLGLIRRDRFVSQEYVRELKSKNVEAIIKNMKKPTFASSLRFELDSNGRKNIIIFLLKKLFIKVYEDTTTMEKKGQMSTDIEKIIDLLPINRMHKNDENIDHDAWEEVLNVPDLANILVKIPYGSALNEVSHDIFFGRTPGRFTYAKSWNEGLLKALEKRKLGKGFKEACLKIEADTESVIDRFGGEMIVYKNENTLHEIKELVHQEMRENIGDSRWRENIVRRNLNLDKSWTHDFIPHLTAKEAILVYTHLDKFRTKTRKSLERIISMADAVHGGIKEAGKNVSSIGSVVGNRQQLKNAKKEIKEGLELAREMLITGEKALLEVNSLDARVLLERMVLFFYGKDEKGITKIKKSQNWRKFSTDFLKFEYPSIFNMLGSEKGINQSNELSLAFSKRGSLSTFTLSGIDNNCQKSLIKLLQRFATSKGYFPANTPDKLDLSPQIEDYSVIIPPKKYRDPSFFKIERRTLQGLPDMDKWYYDEPAIDEMW